MNSSERHLQRRRGTAVTEFLVFAPILVLVGFAAYDLNKRIEDKATVTIMARNATYLGPGVGDARQQGEAKRSIGAIAHVVDDTADAPELTRLKQVISGNDAEGFSVQIETIDTAAVTRRMGAQTGVQTVAGDGAAGSSFDTISRTTATVGVLGVRVVDGIEGPGQRFRIFMEDPVRKCVVETNVKGEANAMQRAMSVVAEVAANSSAGVRGEVLGKSRHYGQTFFTRSEAGFHPNAHKSFGFAGMAMGLTKSGWGADGSFSDSSGGIQTRCMTRLAGSSACGGSGTADQKQRAFLTAIKGIASAKLALSIVLAIVPGGVAVDEAITEGVKQIASTFLDEALTQLGDKAVKVLEDKLESGAQSMVQNQLDRLKDEPQKAVESLLTNLKPGDLGGKILEN